MNKVFGIDVTGKSVWMPGVLSRKKQVAAPILAALIERPAFQGPAFAFARYRLRRDIVGYFATYSQNDAKERFGEWVAAFADESLPERSPCGFVLRSDVSTRAGRLCDASSNFLF